jgi:hypothetical protein
MYNTHVKLSKWKFTILKMHAHISTDNVNFL